MTNNFFLCGSSYANLDEYILSDDMALGFFDADGSVALITDYSISRSGKKGLGYSIKYSVRQSPAKADMTVKFAEKFGARSSIGEVTQEFKVNHRSKDGLSFRQFLQHNAPLHPYRYRDFLLSEVIIKLLAGPKDRLTDLCIAFLMKHKSKFVRQKKADEYFTKCCNHIDAQKAEIQRAIQKADPFLRKVEAKVNQLEQRLDQSLFSDDYLYGAHFGDGSLYVAFSWKPPESKLPHRIRCDAQWTLSGDHHGYCKTIAAKFGGKVVGVDKNNQSKACVSKKEGLDLIISWLQKAPWMPAYKQGQFKRWEQAVQLIDWQAHFTQKGQAKLLDLMHNQAEYESSKYSREELEAWGALWLNDSKRQKRKPKGYNQLEKRGLV